MPTFDFHEYVQVKAEGNNNSLRELDKSYFYFKTENNQDQVDINININKSGFTKKQIETSLGSLEEKFGRSGQHFIIRRFGDDIVLNTDWDQFTCSHTPGHLVRTLLEGEIRKRLVQYDMAMIHASCVKYDGRILAFPAWQHTGKTNILLTLLTKGADYLGDDRVIIDKNGRVYSFPTKIHLFPYNYDTFPELARSNIISKKRGELSMWLDKVVSDYNNIFSKGIDIFNTTFISQSDWIEPRELFSNVDILKQGEIDSLYLLLTNERVKEPRTTEINNSDISKSLGSINKYEWDGMIEEISIAFDMLFPESKSKFDELREFQKEEQKIHRDFVSNVDTQGLALPPEEYWGKRSRETLLQIFES